MRRLRAIIGGGVLALAAAGPASAAPAQYGNPYTVQAPFLFGNCGPGSGVTYGAGVLKREIKNTPSGPLNEIIGSELFTITCQPLSGSITLQLQFRSGNNWVDAADPARFNFPTTVRGFQLVVGPWVCQGLKTSWRIAIFSSGISGDGSVWGRNTQFDPALGGSSGRYFNCG